MYPRDTIAAVATPTAKGAIGIIRISGPDALTILGRIFKGRTFNKLSPAPRHLYSGCILDTDDNTVVDSVLATYMKSPGTYTGEDVVEVHCHGGLTVIDKILSLMTSWGARPAEPGEFTKRAFINGRMDLTQAESVIDIIDSGTVAALKLAAKQHQGILYEHLKRIRRELLDIRSSLEVAIDFPEDENEILSPEAVVAKSQRIIDNLTALINSYEQGRFYRNGVSAAIIGKPNVGKSSLLNAILQDNRAIVTATPGTTRDIIRESINVKGFPVHFLDTAGITKSADDIEQIGVERSYAAIEDSDLLILVLDGSREPDNRDKYIISRIPLDKSLVAINKSDLPQCPETESFCDEYAFLKKISISALEHLGIDMLIQSIYDFINGSGEDPAAAMLLTNLRHKNLLEKTGTALHSVIHAVTSGHSAELITVDLQSALDAIGEITGETATDDILNTIFNNFCIGK